MAAFHISNGDMVLSVAADGAATSSLSPPPISPCFTCLCASFIVSVCPFVCPFLCLLALPPHLSACLFIWRIGGCPCFGEDRVPPCFSLPSVSPNREMLRVYVHVLFLKLKCILSLLLSLKFYASCIQEMQGWEKKRRRCVGHLHFPHAMSRQSLI